MLSVWQTNTLLLNTNACLFPYTNGVYTDSSIYAHFIFSAGLEKIQLLQNVGFDTFTKAHPRIKTAFVPFQKRTIRFAQCVWYSFVHYVRSGD